MNAAGSVGRTARWIALAALLAFAVIGGGRVTSSDEVTMLDLSRALLHGHIDVPEGATLRGPDGRCYTKNTAGQAVLALPLVAVGERVAAAARLDAGRTELVTRAVASGFNAIVTALLLAAFYAVARAFGVRPGAALASTALLAFTTPLVVYAKSFMAEPLEATGLLLALGGAALAGAGGADATPGESRWARVAALGAFLAVSAKASMLPLALLALTALGTKRPARWTWPLSGLAAAALGHLLYNAARFGTPFESGYGAQASPDAFSTPLLVGAYGLLLSSGKGLMWFAPAVWLAPWGAAAMRRERAHHTTPRHAAASAAARTGLLVFAAAVVQFGTFQHWGGDGSWGPRYLVPTLPLVFLAVAFALDGASRARKRIAWALALAGLLVQAGGVAIHYGAEMREVGDYPYTLALEDMHFMEASHFNPRFSPIGAHWRMAVRNAGALVQGRGPTLAVGAADADKRLGIPASDQVALLGALDFWWCYARYAGLPIAPLVTAALVLVLGAWWAAARARAASLVEERSP